MQREPLDVAQTTHTVTVSDMHTISTSRLTVSIAAALVAASLGAITYATSTDTIVPPSEISLAVNEAEQAHAAVTSGTNIAERLDQAEVRNQPYVGQPSVLDRHPDQPDGNAVTFDVTTWPETFDATTDTKEKRDAHQEYGATVQTNSDTNLNTKAPKLSAGDTPSLPAPWLNIGPQTEANILYFDASVALNPATTSYQIEKNGTVVVETWTESTFWWDYDVTSQETYIYRVRYLHHGTFSPWSPLIEAKTLTTPTPTPQNVTDQTITLSWDPVPGADRYEIEYSVEQGEGTVLVGTVHTTDTYVTVGHLRAETDYFFAVRALYRNTGASGFTNPPIRISTLAWMPPTTTVMPPSPTPNPGTPLEAPVAVPAAANRAIVVDWNLVNGATSYEIDYAPSRTTDLLGDHALDGVADINGLTGNMHTIDNLTPGVSYDIAVRASNVATGSVSEWSWVRKATPNTRAAGQLIQASTCTEPAATGPGNGGVVVVVPAVTVLRTGSDGTLRAVMTNSNCSPRTTDKVYMFPATGPLYEVPATILANYTFVGDFTQTGIYQYQN